MEVTHHEGVCVEVKRSVKPRLLLDVDLNEAEAIQHYLEKARLAMHKDLRENGRVSLDEYRESLPYNSLSAAMLRICDDIAGPILKARRQS